MKYLCTYRIPVENNENRYYALSAVDKANYIIDLLVYNNIGVEIVSDSRTLNKKGKCKERIDIINENISITSESTFGASNFFKRFLQKMHSIFWLTNYFITKCKKNECVLVYHSVFYALPLLIARKFKKIRIVLEVEEIFYNLTKTNIFRRFIEKKILKSADAYIFSSIEMNGQCNFQQKPFIVINGVCNPVFLNQQKVSAKKNEFSLIYAGLIKLNGVVFKCLEISEFLDSRFNLKIIGYGSQKDIDLLVDKINLHNIKYGCKVQYDGVKRGKQYNEYVQKCDVGICPLTINRKFQSSCFPSKILSYLSNGLSVVTSDNQTIKNSSFSDYIIFSRSEEPKIFAETIMSNIEKLKCDYRSFLLDEKEKNIRDVYQLFNCLINGVK